MKMDAWEEMVIAQSESGRRRVPVPAPFASRTHFRPTLIKDEHTRSDDLALESEMAFKIEERNIFLLRSRRNDLTSTVPVTQTRERAPDVVK
ncbi:unnamed protein product [Euphydryas editha]|uniref:Uncharacterized protein n=1 Tax=Euphydryas editha TaxID=104508 RepID=A0AAU9TNC7_EUPED|nr:unnamed protein product [Euphydryas editha]